MDVYLHIYCYKIKRQRENETQVYDKLRRHRTENCLNITTNNGP